MLVKRDGGRAGRGAAPDAVLARLIYGTLGSQAKTVALRRGKTMARWFAARDTEPTRTTTRPIRTEEEVRAFLRLLPRYRVLLYNDDVNTFEHVIASLIEVVPSLATTDAGRIAWTAHTTGCADVIVCLKEQAEHYRVGLERRALTSTIEPV